MSRAVSCSLHLLHRSADESPQMVQARLVQRAGDAFQEEIIWNQK